MRKLVIVAALMLATAQPARAEFGFGFFIGQPTGLDIKIDLSHRSALDFVAGYYSHWGYIDHGGYIHGTWLYQPFMARSGGVAIPLRIGAGIALFDDNGHFGDNDVNVAARFPFEIGFRFLRTPVEIYLEIALKFTFIDPDVDHPFVDLDGGLGVRFMF